MSGPSPSPSPSPSPWSLTVTAKGAYVRGPLVGRGVKRDWIMQYDLRTQSKATRARRIANARLITAAPNLYAALERLVSSIPQSSADVHEPGCMCYIHEAYAALNQAKASP